MTKEKLEMKIRCAIGDILEEYDGTKNNTYSVDIHITHEDKLNTHIIDCSFNDIYEPYEEDE